MPIILHKPLEQNYTGIKKLSFYIFQLSFRFLLSLPVFHKKKILLEKIHGDELLLAINYKTVTNTFTWWTPWKCNKKRKPPTSPRHPDTFHIFSQSVIHRKTAEYTIIRANERSIFFLLLSSVLLYINRLFSPLCWESWWWWRWWWWRRWCWMMFFFVVSDSLSRVICCLNSGVLTNASWIVWSGCEKSCTLQ